MVCDTDALATVVWWERYLDAPPDPAMRFSDARLADAYVITSPHDVSFLQDGVRDGEHVRLAMRPVRRVGGGGRPYLEVSGTEAERLDLVIEWLAGVEAARPRFATGRDVSGGAVRHRRPACRQHVAHRCGGIPEP